MRKLLFPEVEQTIPDGHFLETVGDEENEPRYDTDYYGNTSDEEEEEWDSQEVGDGSEAEFDEELEVEVVKDESSEDEDVENGDSDSTPDSE